MWVPAEGDGSFRWEWNYAKGDGMAMGPLPLSGWNMTCTLPASGPQAHEDVLRCAFVAVRTGVVTATSPSITAVVIGGWDPAQATVDFAAVAGLRWGSIACPARTEAMPGKRAVMDAPSVLDGRLGSLPRFPGT